MCGGYRRTTSEEELARLCHIPIPEQTDWLSRLAIDRQHRGNPNGPDRRLKLAPLPLASLTCHQSVFIYDYQRLYVL
jgi:hypothetical protein